MNTYDKTISDRGTSRASPLQSAAEMQQEAHKPAVSSSLNSLHVLPNLLGARELNEKIRQSASSCFAVTASNAEEDFLHKSTLLLNKKNRTGIVVQHDKETRLCISKAAWKYLRGFNESLSGEAMTTDFIERAVLQREFTIVEFYER